MALYDLENNLEEEQESYRALSVDDIDAENSLGLDGTYKNLDGDDFIIINNERCHFFNAQEDQVATLKVQTDKKIEYSFDEDRYGYFIYDSSDGTMTDIDSNIVYVKISQ